MPKIETLKEKNEKFKEELALEIKSKAKELVDLGCLALTSIVLDEEEKVELHKTLELITKNFLNF